MDVSPFLQHLRAIVQDEDVDVAIRVMLESFIQAQKLSVMRTLRRQFAKYLTFRVQFNSMLLYELQGLVKDTQLFEIVRALLAAACLRRRPVLTVWVCSPSAACSPVLVRRHRVWRSPSQTLSCVLAR